MYKRKRQILRKFLGREPTSKIIEVFDIIIAEGEAEFENLIKDYDYFVDLSAITNRLFKKSEGSMLAYCKKVEKWLRDNCSGPFICFPSAMGKYSHKSNGVFFKSKADAILFKLSF